LYRIPPKSAFLCLFIILTTAGAIPVDAAEPLNVLFIGNSYTAANNLPNMVTTLARAGKQRPIAAKAITPGGYTFAKHLALKKTQAAIKAGDWDVVVLQQQSQMPVFMPDVTRSNAVKLHAEIKEHNPDARIIFYLTWAREHIPDMQKGLNATYFAAAKETKSEVAPTGIAWEAARKANPELKLYTGDKSHPNAAGTYLTACVFYATIFDADPTGLPGAVARLSNEQAKELQTVAWQTVNSFKADESAP